jgi:hypothetical protein
VRHVHSQRLERWLGTEKVESLSRNYRAWYGRPVQLIDVPGNVFVTGGGEFVGDFDRGYFASARDSLHAHLTRLWRNAGTPQHGYAGVGFASISDALFRSSSGYGQTLSGSILKNGATAVTGAAMDLFLVGSQPTAGVLAAAAPGGAAPTSATLGALSYNNPSGSDTMHLTGADMACSVASNSLLLYDRIFNVSKTMNSTATEAVTGVPTRYQSTTTTSAEYAAGNFLFIEAVTGLPATAHNWTTCLYTDQDGNTGATLPSVTGTASNPAGRLDMPIGTFFCPLASGDSGILALTQMQCSAAVATGTVNFVMGQQIGVMAFPITAMTTPFDWLTNRNQAPRIINNACLALMELPKPSSTGGVYTGQIYVTSAAP